ncbi:cytoplasmic protein [Infundibulicybe gibba]|nr:cytoplasmic protein [Infundibulicybe gibba]
MWLNILKSLFNFFCGDSKPSNDHQSHQQQGYPPPSQPHAQPPVVKPPHRPVKHGDLNQINQQSEHYVSLRARANAEGDQMAKCFEQSHQAYSRGDGAAAKQLSNEGKEHQKRMENLHKQASDWIFLENNKDSGPGEIDLHGLYVKEAILRTDNAIQEAKRRGDTELHLIVGKGLHSQGGVAKIKPAIEDLIQKHRLFAELDPQNAGVLIVSINSNGGQGVGSDEIARRLERKDEGCTIM